MKIAIYALILAGLFGLFLLLFQARMIYYPRPYLPSELAAVAAYTRLTYETPAGKQTAFYRPPLKGGAPRAVWIIFAGNASRALDLRLFAEELPADDTGFYFIDYPGYGLNPGSPSPSSIDAASDAALRALRAHLGPDTSFELNILGNSLGGAAACALAAAERNAASPPKRLVLIAPFTNLAEMASRSVGPIYSKLLLHRFDNTARLREVLSAPVPPQISIFHGVIDEVIPFAMGQELAAIDPARISFHEYRGERHNTILNGAQRDIYAAMTSPG